MTDKTLRNKHVVTFAADAAVTKYKKTKIQNQEDNMKKVMATMLAAATAATMLSGCGSSNSGSTETKAAETTAAAESGAKAEETTAADAADGEKKEIYLLIRARGDLSYWDSMADGGDRAAADFADQANVHVIETTADNQANLTAMYEAADKGADMIITAGDFIDNMVTVAEEYPEISFLMVNEKMEGYDNVYAIDFSTSQAGFLAGIAAADVASQGLEGTSGNKTVGFIGGMDEVTVIEEFFIGYIQGVKYYDPETTVVYNYVGDWGNPDKGRTQALAQYNDMNADVIFACAGGSGNGVHQAASEVGKYVIGVDSDQSATYAEQPEIQKTFVTSVLKKMGNGIYKVIGDFLNDGTLPYGKYEIFGLAEDSVGIVENDLYDQYVSDAGKAMIEEAKKGIADGSITVEGAIGKDQTEIKAEIDELLAK